MKTLDEVIKALTICNKSDIHRNCKDCPMPDTHGCMDILMRDALHYLKEYQGRKEALRHWNEQAISEQQNIADAYMLYKAALEKGKDNVPLTWDELRQMKGKPVWMEDDTGTKNYRGWAIVLNFIFDGTYLRYVCDDYSETCVVEEDLGKTWQAYRKERS